MKVAIIADDLTGANDTGVQLAKKGISTAVQFSVDTDLLDRYDAIVFDSDSRADTQATSYKKVKALCESIQSPSLQWVYKKIDSTMRGNIGAEIDAMYDAFQPDAVVIAPSYPQNGRIVKAGHLYVDGVLLHETDIARDPKTPVKYSYLPDLLGKQTKRPMSLISARDIERGLDHLSIRIRQSMSQQIPYLIFDAETRADLLQIQEVIRSMNLNVVWCGSAGLADVLSSEFSGSEQASHDLSLEGPVLAVIGSVSTNTRKQLDLILRDPDVYGVEMRADKILSDDTRKAECEQVVQTVLNACHHNRHIVLYSSGSAEDIAKAKQIGERLGIGNTEISNRIGRALGEISMMITQHFKIKNLILTGGDTAKQVCMHLGVSGLELIDEIENGAPLGRLSGIDDTYVITKAGGFGDDFALRRYLNLFQKGEWTWSRSLG